MRLRLLLSVGLAACSAPQGSEYQDLASSAPLRRSVLVTGGAFVAAPPAEVAAVRRPRTYVQTGEEVFSLGDLLHTLERARAFVRVSADQRDASARQPVAHAQWPLPAEPTPLEQLLRDARADGHDCLLVLERVDDGPVEAYGVNGQWPITLTTWLLVGLGALIPDHVFEARVSLRASLRDVADGQVLQEFVIAPGPVDLSLLQRTGVWGWVQSIIVPPFWVADDDDLVVERVREAATARLVTGLAQRLKAVDVADKIARSAPAEIVLRRESGRLWLELTTREAVSFVRLRVDQQVSAGVEFDAFHERLLASRRSQDTQATYRAELPIAAGSRLQVVVQTVTGRVGSATLDLLEVR